MIVEADVELRAAPPGPESHLPRGIADIDRGEFEIGPAWKMPPAAVIEPALGLTSRSSAAISGTGF